MSVSDVTQHPEIFDGRVKTLHPAIHGPLLARMQREDDRQGMKDLQYTPISLVACNLYPFVAAASADPPLDKDALLEMIDIGGPTMVRASAKNHANVIICCNPMDYDSIIADLQKSGGAHRVYQLHGDRIGTHSLPAYVHRMTLPLQTRFMPDGTVFLNCLIP